MNDKKLIELVRNYPVLYDLSNPKYMDTEFKTNIWNKIGEEMKTPGPSCKSRWSNIRDNFRKSLKKTASGQKAKNVKIYKYSEQLGFLTKYFSKFEETKSNIDYVTKKEDEECHDELLPYESVENNESTQNLTEVDGPATGWEQRQTSALKSTQHKKHKRSLVKTTPPQIASSTMEYPVKERESFSTQDPVDAFLSGIAPVLRKLPPHYWHYAKADLFAVVQKYELKLLMGRQCADSSRFSDCSSSMSSEETSPT
ncbi:uncharacterized protein LOC106669821 [Cimex lectularius]|uniref:MADF domain-containing protein n=1 Tax=Cimex lectularius TaxID=79782 RepID=A0A8I6S3E6_CIMLE|nr:uncharacterized protein LOC106669821 [Cimex lectularius]